MVCTAGGAVRRGAGRVDPGGPGRLAGAQPHLLRRRRRAAQPEGAGGRVHRHHQAGTQWTDATMPVKLQHSCSRTCCPAGATVSVYGNELP